MKKSNLKDHIQFENEHVCIFKTTLSENSFTHLEGAWHVVVGLQPGEILEKNNRGQDLVVAINPYQVHSLSHNKISSCHSPLEIMIIEMKGQKDRPLPSIPID
jgi:hypothetical protein